MSLFGMASSMRSLMSKAGTTERLEMTMIVAKMPIRPLVYGRP